MSGASMVGASAAHVYLGPNNATDVWSVKKINPSR